MMLEKNLDSLHEELLAIKEQLIQYAGEGQHQLETGTEQIEGREILYAMQDGKLFQLDTMYDEEAFLDIWMSDMNATFNTKFTMFGFGNGMFVRKLLAATEDETSIYIYEPSVDIFLTSLKTYDLTDILSCDRVHIWIAGLKNEERTFYDFLVKYIDYTDVSTSRHCIYPNYNILYPTEHQEYVENSQQAIDSVAANRSVMERFGWRYYENPFSNAPYFCYGKSLSNLWSFMDGDIPAIIVSSGPSLNKNIEQLKQAKGRALMIAADSAVKALLSHDIIPDMFVCVDANKNAGHFTDERILDIPMLCTQNTAYVALQNHRAPMFFEKDENPHCMTFLAKQGLSMVRLGTGGSVATVAMNFAQHLGIQTIILVGQDLAYTGNKTHAEGSLRSTWKVDIETTKCYIEGQDGNPILSSNEFKLYRDWFEREIAEHEELTVINATEGGAKIHGAHQMTLQEALLQYCKKEYNVTRFFLYPSYYFTKQERTLYEDYMNQIPVHLERLHYEIQRGISTYEKMEQLLREGKQNSQKFLTYYQNTSELSEKLQKDPVMYYPECLIQTQIGQMLKEVYDSSGDEVTDLRESLIKAKAYLKLVNDKIEEVVPDSRARLEQTKEIFRRFENEAEYLFENQKLDIIWEQFMRMITPELGWEDYYLLLHNLETTLSVQNDKEYPKLLDKIFWCVKALRKEMVLFQLAVLSFLAEVYPDRCKEVIACMEQICYSNELLHGRHLLYLWENFGKEQFEDSEKFRQYARKKCISDVKAKIKPHNTEEKKIKAIVGILSTDERNEVHQQVIDRCVSLAKEKSGDEKLETVFVCTYEKGYWGGLIPLYHKEEMPKMHPDHYLFSYEGEEYSCIVPKRHMPDVEGYQEVLTALAEYDIVEVVADQDSIAGELLNCRKTI